MTGTFSGGPNGALRFTNDGEEIVMRVINGQILRTGMPELGELPISNPGAFRYWEK